MKNIPLVKLMALIFLLFKDFENFEDADEVDNQDVELLEEIVYGDNLKTVDSTELIGFFDVELQKVSQNLSSTGANEDLSSDISPLNSSTPQSDQVGEFFDLTDFPVYLVQSSALNARTDAVSRLENGSPHVSANDILEGSTPAPAPRHQLVIMKNGRPQCYAKIFYKPHPHPRLKAFIICLPCLVLFQKGLLMLCKVKKYKSSGGNEWHLKHLQTHGINESNWSAKADEFENYEIKEGMIVIRDREYDRLQCEFFVSGKIPFRQSDNPAYHALMNYKREPMRILSARRMASSIGRFFIDAQTKIKMIFLMHKGPIFLSADGWSAESADGYFAVAAHWKHDILKVLLRLLIYFEFFPKSHTAERVAEEIFKAMEFYGIIGKVLTITTDNGSNMVAAIPKLNRLLETHCCQKGIPFRPIRHIRCFAHTLHLAVDKASQKMDGLVTKVKDLINRVKYVKPLREKFEIVAKSLCNSGVPRVPSLGVRTRWNSTYKMLERTLHFKKAFIDIHEDPETKDLIDCYMPSKLEWFVIKAYCSFLKSSADATRKISGSTYPTLNQVAACYNEILRSCEIITQSKKPEKGFALNLYEAAETLISELISRKDRIITTESTVAAILDPTIEHSTGFTRDNYEVLKDLFENRFPGVLDPTTSQPSTKASAVSSELGSLNEYDEEELEQLRILKELSSSRELNGHFTARRRLVKNELERFYDMNINGSGREHQQSVFWAAHQVDFPHLFQLSEEYLYIPGSSVACEGYNSEARYVLRADRNRLNRSNVSILLKHHSALELINFCCQRNKNLNKSSDWLINLFSTKNSVSPF